MSIVICVVMDGWMEKCLTDEEKNIGLLIFFYISKYIDIKLCMRKAVVLKMRAYVMS